MSATKTNYFRSKVISTSGFCRRHFWFPMSADVGPCRQCHILVWHGRKCGGSRWNRVEIYFRSKVISTSGFGGRHFEFQMSADVGPCRQCHICVGRGKKNVGVAVGIASPSLYIFPFNRYFHFRFHGRHFEFRMSADVGPCRQCHV